MFFSLIEMAISRLPDPQSVASTSKTRGEPVDPTRAKWNSCTYERRGRVDHGQRGKVRDTDLVRIEGTSSERTALDGEMIVHHVDAILA